MALPSPLTLVMLVTITVGVSSCLLAWRERPEPGAWQLALMLAGQSWWSVFFVFELEAMSLSAKVFWSNVLWIGVVVIPVAWFLFAMAYTGNDRFVRPRYVALLSVVPAVTIVLVFTGNYHDLMFVDSTVVQQGGIRVLERVGGPWYWVIAGYTYLLGLLGSIPLIGLVGSDAMPFRGQSLALLVGTLAPWASNVLFLAGAIPVAGLDPTPVAFTISGVAYLAALSRFRLFGTNPSPNRRARRLVFDRMVDGAVVVDAHDNVVDMNARAAETLGVVPREVLGDKAESIIPGYETLPDEGPSPEHLTVRTESGTHFYDATVTRIDDYRGQVIGRVVAFHDVGDHLRQQQRLEVLNRVLRHNIRTETNLIAGYADLVAEGNHEMTEEIKNHARRIDGMGEKAREISDIFEGADGSLDAAPLGSMLDDAVSAARADYPELTVEYDRDHADVYVADVLHSVFSNLLENAAEHNPSDDPWVEVDVGELAGRVRISVSDNGPGITDYERSVLQQGTETPLEHGSGLGLWLIKWGTAIAGGTVEFVDTDGDGSVVTVEVPTLPPPEYERTSDASVS